VVSRFLALTLVLGLLLGGLAAGRAEGAGTPPEAGHVVSLVPRVDGGYDLRYRSIGVAGDTVEETAALWLPAGRRTGNVVAWAHPTTGLADRCAPSALDRLDIAGRDALLADGNIVVAPDYEGLGTRGVHPYLVGASEGRSVLDAIRAARSVGDAHGRSTVYGWSQGGHAALFAARMAPTYAPDVRLSGAVAIAPVTSMIAAVDGSTLLSRIPGVVAMIAAGYLSAYPKLDAADLVGNPARDIPTAISRCDVADALKDATSSPPDAAWTRMLRRNDAAGAVVKVPSLIVHGAEDNLLPVTDSEAAYDRLCALRSNVRLRIYTAENHMSVPQASAAFVVRWMEDRLAGKRSNGCSESHVA
jgi:dienelactone hydrolase